MSDEMIGRVARAIGNSLHASGVFKNGAGDPWTDGPCLLASRAAIEATTVKGDELVEGQLTEAFIAMAPLQKWETLALNGLLGTREPWIGDMRQSLKAQADTITTLKGEIERQQDTPYGDAGDALDWSLDHLDDAFERTDFLERWREGDVSEWPDYARWLSVQRRGRDHARQALSQGTAGGRHHPPEGE